MLTLAGLNWVSSKRTSSAGNCGRSAFISRSISSCLLSGSESASNSTKVVATLSWMVLVSFFTFSSAFMRPSKGSTTRRSRSEGEAPGSTETTRNAGVGKVGSSALGMENSELAPSAINATTTTSVSCQRLTENSASMVRSPCLSAHNPDLHAIAKLFGTAADDVLGAIESCGERDTVTADERDSHECELHAVSLEHVN